MKHTDEKGHFSPAQSGTAKRYGPGNPSPMHQAITKQMADYPRSSTTERGGRHLAHGASGLLELHHQNKAKARSRLKVIARGKKNEGHKAYTKIGTRFHRKGLLKPPA